MGIIPVEVLAAAVLEIGFCAGVCQDSNQIFQQSGMVEIFRGAVEEFHPCAARMTLF